MANLNDIEKKMKASLDNFKHQMAGLRTGRANAGLVENIRAEIYGSQMPISQCASISIPEPRTISINVWDMGNVTAVEKAIQTSGLGLNPNTEGTVIRLNLPELTEERRKDLVKLANQQAEQARVAIRNIRRDGNDSAKREKNEGKISEDILKSTNDKIQKFTDDFIAQVDKVLKDKEAEILKV